MTPEQILKELIELAWANGWEGGHEFYRKYNQADTVASAALSSYIGVPEETHSEGFESVNAIIFDRSFIKALCKAKYTKDMYQGFDEAYEWDTRELCKSHLMRLAISTDRLNYLKEQFLK